MIPRKLIVLKNATNYLSSRCIFLLHVIDGGAFPGCMYLSSKREFYFLLHPIKSNGTHTGCVSFGGFQDTKCEI